MSYIVVLLIIVGCIIFSSFIRKAFKKDEHTTVNDSEESLDRVKLILMEFDPEVQKDEQPAEIALDETVEKVDSEPVEPTMVDPVAKKDEQPVESSQGEAVKIVDLGGSAGSEQVAKTEDEIDAAPVFLDDDNTCQTQEYTMLYDEFGVELNSPVVLKWYRQEAERGNAKAQFVLGKAYYDGYLGPDSESNAINLLQDSANRGYADAQFMLGCIYYLKEKSAPTFDKTLLFLKQAAKRGHADANYILGYISYKEAAQTKDYSKSINIFLNIAAQDYLEAQYMLGIIFHNGEGVDKNDKAAVRWFEQAAQQGHQCSLYMLGNIFYNGEGVEQDQNKALEYFSKAAQLGTVSEQYQVGEVILDRPYLDLKFAVECFNDGYQRDIPDAYVGLGFLYYFGNGVQSDHNKAFRFFMGLNDKSQDPMVYGKTELNSVTAIIYANKISTDAYSGAELLSRTDLSEQEYTEALFIQAEGFVVSLDRIQQGVIDDDELETYNIAESYYEKAINRGHVTALYRLGKLYQNRPFGEPLTEQAIECFKQAASKGSAEAQYELFRLFQEGERFLGYSRSFARYCLIKAAKQNYSLAKKALLKNPLPYEQYEQDEDLSVNQVNSCAEQCVMQYEVIDLEQNSPEAISWYKEESQRGNAKASFLLAKAQLEWYLKGSIFSNPNELIEELAKQGYADAQFYNGAYILFVVRIWVDAAYMWFEKAADQGHVEAQFLLGMRYYSIFIGNQEDVFDMDRFLAFDLFMKAAEHGMCDAQYMLGVMFYTGCAVIQNYTEAYKWFDKAAAQGHQCAQCMVGILLFKGEGVDKDTSKAIGYFSKALIQGEIVNRHYVGKEWIAMTMLDIQEQIVKCLNEVINDGNIDAQVCLGLYCYYKGGFHFIRKAQECFELAAKHGNVIAQLYLGRMKFEDAGCDDTILKEAFNLFVKAAVQGSVEAMHYIGELYFINLSKGFVVFKTELDSTQEAKDWFFKAAEQGNILSLSRLSEMFIKNLLSEQESTKVVDWLNQSATEGNAEAQYYLGCLYNQGYDDFVPQDTRLAHYWFAKAYNQNHERAKDELFKLERSYYKRA